MKTKLYLYGVIKADESKSLGPLGLSTDGSPSDILLHTKDGLGIAYAEKELDDDDELPASRKNLVNHQRVMELLMAQSSVLPFAFGTIIDDLQGLSDLIDEKRMEFEASLAKVEGRIELSLKVMWEQMDPVFESILTGNLAISQKRQYMIDNNIEDQDEKIELGKMVQEALEDQKEAMLNMVLDKLEPKSIEHKVQKNITDSMFANLAFFVDKAAEKSFDESVNELSGQLGENIALKYIGPIPPVNFI